VGVSTKGFISVNTTLKTKMGTMNCNKTFFFRYGTHSPMHFDGNLGIVVQGIHLKYDAACFMKKIFFDQNGWNRWFEIELTK